MDIAALALAILPALAGPIASIKVAMVSAGRTIEDITKRLDKMAERVTAIETTEPEQVARLRGDIEALGKDVGALRSVVDRLVAADEREEKRREKAEERAERRELREREQEATLAAKLATVHTLLDTLREELRNARR
jgi:Skp family chaperone for outer membrane proteins